MWPPRARAAAAIRRDILSSKFYRVSSPNMRYSSRKTLSNPCWFCVFTSWKTTACYRPSHRCWVWLQSGESGGWCSTITPSCSMRSRTIPPRCAGRDHLDKKSANDWRAHGSKFFFEDVQVQCPSDNAIQNHQLGSSTSMKGVPNMQWATTSCYGILYTMFVKGLSLKRLHIHSDIYAMQYDSRVISK